MKLKRYNPNNIRVRVSPPMRPPIYRGGEDDAGAVNTSETSILDRMFESIRGLSDEDMQRTQAEIRMINRENRGKYERMLRRFREAYPDTPVRGGNINWQNPGP